MSLYGQVKVKKNRYRFKGDFHFTQAGSAIRDEDNNWKLMGVTKPRHMVYVHAYGGEANFFEGLSQGKLLGTRCDNPDCETKGSVYLPYRIHCPDCLVRNVEVDLTKTAQETAKIHTFMICERSGAFNTLDKPIRFINLEFDGVCTILMSYLIGGEPEIGKRAIPIFRKRNPTYTITDLAWVLEGTKAEDLPQDFSF